MSHLRSSLHRHACLSCLAPAPTGSFCCGDAVCDGEENTSTCALDCGPPPAPFCGDGNVDLGEICDGANLNGDTCVDLGFTSGTLSCQSDCLAYDISSCSNDECVYTADEQKKGKNGRALCSDGIDNDCDGNIDGADPDC